MTTLQLLEEHPKVAKFIHEYYLQVMLDSLNDDGLPEDFKSFVMEQGIDNDKIIEMIEKNPRNLFDFFDEHRIIIEMTFVSELGLLGQFVPIVNGEADDNAYGSRKHAEKQAVETAISMLEERLTESVSSKENS